MPEKKGKVKNIFNLPSHINAPVAQLDRVSDSDSEGRAFESHQAYHKKRMFKNSCF